MLKADLTLADGYSSRSQQVRRISEDWILRHAYCLRCTADQLTATAVNTRTRDFECGRCGHGYELKSKQGAFSTKVLDGAYGAMLETIRSGRTPTFLLMEYSPEWAVRRIVAIHHSLITAHVVEPRKPLSPTARRAGWVGCNLLLPFIANHGKIPVLSDGVLLPRDEARKTFAKLEPLSALPVGTRGWATTVLRLTERLNQRFSLQHLYGFEAELQTLFPNNRNIRPKIRQQLQFLRDAGLITFLGEGNYERTYRD